MRIVYDLLEKRQTQESQGNNQRESKTETTFSWQSYLEIYMAAYTASLRHGRPLVWYYYTLSHNGIYNIMDHKYNHALCVSADYRFKS